MGATIENHTHGRTETQALLLTARFAYPNLGATDTSSGIALHIFASSRGTP